MFPEETLHCVEWARDKFGKIFTLRPKSVQKILDDANFAVESAGETKQVREAVKLLKNRPLVFDDCVEYAVRKFYKYFRNDVR